VSRTVLLIDDEPDIREVAGTALRALAGWEVLAAGGGEEGMTVATERRPDAILLDVMMPGLDGPATLERLRADPVTAEIPVLFMTAKAQAGELTRFAALGVTGVIAKPFDPMTLHQRVSDALGWAA
jgi:CheY-like chemotaxis protein